MARNNTSRGERLGRFFLLSVLVKPTQQKIEKATVHIAPKSEGGGDIVEKQLRYVLFLGQIGLHQDYEKGVVGNEGKRGLYHGWYLAHKMVGLKV